MGISQFSFDKSGHRKGLVQQLNSTP